HSALDVHYRMARRAPKSVLCFRSVDLFLNRSIEPPVEENGVIMTTSAPFERLRPTHVLHVLNRFSVPLVVERSEMMGRRIPLIVNLFVTASAFLARHEERRWVRDANGC